MKKQILAALFLSLILSLGFESCENPAGTRNFLAASGPILFVSNKSGTYQLYSMNQDGSNVQQLTNDHNFQITNAKWSPDGNKIAIMTPVIGPGPYKRKIYVMNADGTGRYLLTDGITIVQDLLYGQVGYIGVSNRGGLVWSPDPKQLAFASWHTSEPVPNSDVFTINVEGSDMRRVTEQNNESISGKNFHNWTVTGWTYSSQGNDMLLGDLQYLAGANHHPADSILAFGLDGKETMSRTDGWGPAVPSPDGKQIAYTVYSGQQGLEIVNADGSEMRVIEVSVDLSTGEWFKPVCWSPDRYSILVDYRSSSRNQIFVLNAYSGAITNITPFDAGATDWRR